MSTRSHYGLTETALAYWRDYAVTGIGMVAVFALLSVPAAVAVWIAFPSANSLFVLAVLSLGLHMGAAFVRDVRQGEYEPSEDAEFFFENAFLLLGILVLYVVPLTLVAAIGGDYVRVKTGAQLLGLGVALYYPVVDYELLKRGAPTPSALPVLGLFTLLHAIGLCRNISPQQVIRRFRQRPPMPRLQ